jgi:troponin T
MKREEEKRRQREMEEKKKKEAQERLLRLKEAEKRREALAPKDKHLRDSGGAGVTRARTKSEVNNERIC